MNRCAGLLVAVMVAIATHAAQAQTYEIKLTRPVKVGERYHVEARADVTNRATPVVDGELQPTEVSGFTADIRMVEEVLAVGALGKPTRVRLTIDHCVVRSRTGRVEELPKGTIVDGSQQGDEATFEIEGRPVSENLREALDLITELSENDVDDDRIFGSSEPRRPGESWPVNAELAAEELGGLGMSVEAEGVTGTMELVRLRHRAGQECLEIKGEITVSGFKAPPGVVPPGLRVSRSTMMRAEYSVLLPTDPTMQALSGTHLADGTVRMTGEIPNSGEHVEVDLSRAQTISFKRTRVG